MQGWLKRWVEPVPSSAESLRDRIAASRGIPNHGLARFLAPSVADLPTPASVHGAREVGTRLVQALRESRNIAVYGDYDADGMCAAAILVHALRALAPTAPLEVHIPNRATDPYGLAKGSIDQLAARGFRTIVSVDCGVTAFAEAAHAKELGVELLVTDHHSLDPGGRLPEAAAIAHPGLGETPTDLCGAAVAWVVAAACFEAWSAPNPIDKRLAAALAETLALAAVGTVADIVPMKGHSRVIARLGLPGISTSPLPGLKALAREAKISPRDHVDAERISFGIGPLLNSCGRLGSAMRGVELLALPSASTPKCDVREAERTAGRIANEFGALNARRKDIEHRIVEEAQQRIDEGLGSARGACVLADSGWQRGIVGIACARLAEQYGVPTVLLECKDGTAHGSGRSVNGYSLLDGLRECAHLLERFGGHASAAGVSVRVEDIPAFREALSSHAARHPRSGGELLPEAEFHARDCTVESLEGLEQLGPFGAGFPQPLVLVRSVRVSGDARAFGANGDHLSFFASFDDQSGREVRCLWWRQGARTSEFMRGRRLHLVARPQVDRYAGIPRPSLVVVDAADALDG